MFPLPDLTVQTVWERASLQFRPRSRVLMVMRVRDALRRQRRVELLPRRPEGGLRLFRLSAEPLGGIGSGGLIAQCQPGANKKTARRRSPVTPKGRKIRLNALLHFRYDGGRP